MLSQVSRFTMFFLTRESHYVQRVPITYTPIAKSQAFFQKRQRVDSAASNGTMLVAALRAAAQWEIPDKE